MTTSTMIPNHSTSHAIGSSRCRDIRQGCDGWDTTCGNVAPSNKPKIPPGEGYARSEVCSLPILYDAEANRSIGLPISPKAINLMARRSGWKPSTFTRGGHFMVGDVTGFDAPFYWAMHLLVLFHHCQGGPRHGPPLVSGIFPRLLPSRRHQELTQLEPADQPSPPSMAGRFRARLRSKSDQGRKLWLALVSLIMGTFLLMLDTSVIDRRSGTTPSA